MVRRKNEGDNAERTTLINMSLVVELWSFVIYCIMDCYCQLDQTLIQYWFSRVTCEISPF